MSMRYFTFLLLALFSTSALAQTLIETRTAKLMNGDYLLEGTVYLESFDDNTLQLRFDSDYLTQSNVFDVHVFLTNDNNYEAPIDTSGMYLVENIGTINGLNYSSGPMTFDISPDININDYDHIVFVCVQFGRLHWGDGTFEAPVVSTQDVNSMDITYSLFPNPSLDGFINIQFEELQSSVFIEILNSEGKEIRSDRLFNLKNHMIEIQNSGTYMLKITTSKGSRINKLIVK